MSYPADLKYTKEHEWIRIEGELRTRTEGGEAESILRDSKKLSRDS